MSKESEGEPIEEIESMQINTPQKSQSKKDETGYIGLIEAIKPLVEIYLNHKKDESEAATDYFQKASTHNRNMLYVMTVFLAVIIGFMSWLTYSGLVSGDALLFLVGTVTGYILLFIQKLISPTNEKTEDN
ncbi:MAG: hypothetical protein ACBZ72_06280 [Candidatus Bathyarchaeia archaeon]|jgi:hypothetical protein